MTYGSYCQEQLTYMSSSLIRNRHPLGPYRRPLPRVLGGPRGRAFSCGWGTPAGEMLWIAVKRAPSLEKPPDLDPFFDDLTGAKSAKELKERAFQGVL